MEAIANLVQNAIKFLPPGGEVTVTAEVSPLGPIIRVADNGTGIPPDQRDKIFNRFYRLDKSRNLEGNGLGLSLVASIVRLHGFDIRVADASPGAIFELTCLRESS
jgi:signal transduction histidine kinase